jgi:hypothetical protein
MFSRIRPPDRPLYPLIDQRANNTDLNNKISIRSEGTVPTCRVRSTVQHVHLVRELENCTFSAQRTFIFQKLTNVLFVE